MTKKQALAVLGIMMVNVFTVVFMMRALEQGFNVLALAAAFFLGVISMCELIAFSFLE